VEADFSVELASDDERLEVPWAAPDGSCRYSDLKAHPELITGIEEAQREPELARFLSHINAVDGLLQSAKCDVWSTDEISPEEEIFGLPVKFGSYVDMFFFDERRFSFPAHEQFAKTITQLLKKAPEIPASAEFLIRRCYFHDAAGEQDGFYITSYIFGFGNDEQNAHRRWQIGLLLVDNALRQCTS
jgi:hypothetical protein